jgi:tRNA-uridine 2-sulfurtransferase
LRGGIGSDGIAIELAGVEEGVAPGQACVMYDAADGQARVLGGGFIKRDANFAARAGVAAESSLAAARG